MQALNYSALSDRVSARDIYNYLRSPSGKGFILSLFVTFIFGAFTAMAVSIRSQPNVVPVPEDLFMFSAQWGAGVAVVIGVLMILGARNLIRLQRFAAANGFTFIPRDSVNDYVGIIFSTFSKPGASIARTDVITGSYQGIPFSFHNISVPPYGKNQKEYGVIRIMLDRRLPHVLFDSKANNIMRFSNLPAIKNVQQLTLEGDFNTHFTTYVPGNYQRDALYFITPDVMATLIDYSNQYDVELVDNQLYIYSNKGFSLTKVDNLNNIFMLIEHLGGKLARATRNYADANVGNRQANIIAEQGQRLKKKHTLTATIAVLTISLAVMVGLLILLGIIARLITNNH